MSKVRQLFLVTLMVTGLSISSSGQDDPLLQIIKDEVTREMSHLKKATIPPYYLDYLVDDVQYASYSASFGSLVESTTDHTRLFSLRVKVGDYEFDDSHPVNGRNGNYGGGGRRGYGPNPLPIDNDAKAIQFHLWKATEDEYKDALEQYKSVKNIADREAKPSQPLADFSKEQQASYFEKPLAPLVSIYDEKAWIEKIKKLSTVFLKDPSIVQGAVNLRLSLERKYFVTSEGTSVVQNVLSSYINITGGIRADDGDVIPLHRSYYSTTPEGFPSEDVMMKDVQELVTILARIRTAPLAEPYTGPAILMAQTAGVFFHEIFGHRIEGHRLKDEYDGQTFKARINESVLPKTLNVSFDPTITSYKGTPLNGAYAYDDEGVKSRRVNVVENGVLKTFLMSRSPLENISTSNGHGRASIGADPVSRQSNLIVEATKSSSVQDLRKMLIKECQKQKKPYGYLFKEVVGGFTTTDRYNPNAFNIFPTEVYRIYVDGRPDELVRGVDLIGTPLAMFAEIQAAGNDAGIFIGFCGAESGHVPVSAVSPSLFVRRIETQKKPKQHEESMLLSRPASTEQ